MHPLNPATLSPLLQTVLNQIVEKASTSLPRLLQSVAELSRLFTKERGAIETSYLENKAYATAYLSYFLPVNLAKVQVLLDELPSFQATTRLTVLDLGSGPGTGALAVLDWWHRRKVTAELVVIAVDKVPAALQQAKELWDRYCQAAGIAGARLQTMVGNIERQGCVPQIPSEGSYDLIVVANCLNEMQPTSGDALVARTRLVSDALDKLAHSGTVMIIEPALRETARALHHVRDQLLQEQRCTVYSPCLHEQPCPALIHPHDWCHEERAWQPPDSIQDIDRQVGFIKDALKFAYLLLRKDGQTIVERRLDSFRIVSELRVFKGESRVWACNELGRTEIGRQDRMKSVSNAAWDRLERGTIVRLVGLQRKDGAVLQRVPIEGTVDIVRPA